MKILTEIPRKLGALILPSALCLMPMALNSCANASHAVISQRVGVGLNATADATTGKLSVSAAFKRDSAIIVPKIEEGGETENGSVYALTQVHFRGTSIPESVEIISTGQSATNLAVGDKKNNRNPGDYFKSKSAEGTAN